ncbi:hypothetical protein [Actinomadura chibensis]|uniref:Uncharacterized protein n=1 Tax=Actinomadura chibensis TaxID=392828 RepID=A0A5D0NAJ3_9ACTN|nr:hypothetical protein [Actinomadura chibensis]TYB41347.1 hypothetical protein FXF69_34990 [Actinomadura chibensis]
MHSVILTTAVLGYVLSGVITGSWEPSPWPAGFMAVYLSGFAALTGYAVWRGVTGRAKIDTESLGAIKSNCLQEAANRPGPAAAVAMRPVLPHPLTSWLYTTVTAERLGPAAAGTVDVSLRETPGWALTRRTAWNRGLVLAGHPDTHPDAAPSTHLGTMEDPAASHRPLREHGPCRATHVHTVAIACNRSPSS